MATGGIQTGRIGAIYVDTDSSISGALEIGKITDATFTMNKDMIDATTKDSGDYRSYKDGFKDATIEVSALWDETDAGQLLVRAAYFADSDLYAWFRVEDTTGEADFPAQVLVSNMTIGDPMEGMASVDFTLQVTGSFAEADQA
jgi:hypothetical protein